MFFSANQNQYRIRSISSIRVPLLKFHQRMSCHGFGLFEPHQVEDRRGYVGQDTVADRFHAVGNHDDRHRIERMSRIGRAVGIDRIIGVAVIGDLHDLVPIATALATHASTAFTAFSIAS